MIDREVAFEWISGLNKIGVLNCSQGFNPPNPTANCRRVAFAFSVGLFSKSLGNDLGPDFLNWVEQASPDDLQYVFTGSEVLE